MIKEFCGLADEDEQQAAGEGVEGAAVAVFELVFRRGTLCGRDVFVHARKTGGADGFVDEVDSRIHGDRHATGRCGERRAETQRSQRSAEARLSPNAACEWWNLYKNIPLR